jgi:hypothetical protein
VQIDVATADFIPREHLGGRAVRPETAGIARDDPHKLRRDTMRREQVVARHILDVEKLVLRRDLGNVNELHSVDVEARKLCRVVLVLRAGEL